MADDVLLPTYRVEKQKKKGLCLLVGGSAIRLNYTQAGELFESLMRVLPMDDRVSLAWDRRHAYKARVLVHYKFDGTDVVPSGYQAQVLVMKEIVHTTQIMERESHALKLAAHWMGGSLTHEDTIDIPGSHQAAYEQKIMAAVEKHLAETGQSVAEFMAEAAELAAKKGKNDA